jgi:hypothetical protein
MTHLKASSAYAYYVGKRSGPDDDSVHMQVTLSWVNLAVETSIDVGFVTEKL